MGCTDGRTSWQVDVEDIIDARFYPIALQPVGGLVAMCMQRCKAVSVRDPRTGMQLYQLRWEGALMGVSWSADGSLLMVFGGHPKACVKVYAAATGKEMYSRLYSEGSVGNIHHAVIDLSNKLLVTTGLQTGAIVKDLESGETVHVLEDSTVETQGLSFDDHGKRLAYTSRQGKDQSADLVICDTDGWREIRRFKVRDWGWVHVEFSPGKGELLLAKCNPEWADSTTVKGNNIAFLDPETGKEPSWSKIFRLMMLPQGDISHQTIRWVAPQTENDDESPKLIVQASVGSKLHLIDVSAFIQSWEEGGNLSSEQVKQLMELTQLDFQLRCWTCSFDPLSVALSSNNTKLARELVDVILKASSTEDSDAAEQDKTDAQARTSMTLSMAPNMVANLKQMYEKGLGSVATELLQVHGVLEPGYELLTTHADFDTSRVALGDGMASVGSEELNPTYLKKHYGYKGNRTGEKRQGIDWTDYLNEEQYLDEYHNPNRIDVKPAVLAIRDAGRPGNKGLLSVLTQPSVPIAAFDSYIATPSSQSAQ
jgi:hypothetical protein